MSGGGVFGDAGLAHVGFDAADVHRAFNLQADVRRFAGSCFGNLCQSEAVQVRNF